MTGAALKGLLHSDPSSAGIMGILELFVKLGQRIDLHRGCARGGKQGLVLAVDSSGHFYEGVTGMACNSTGVRFYATCALPLDLPVVRTLSLR